LTLEVVTAAQLETECSGLRLGRSRMCRGRGSWLSQKRSFQDKGMNPDMRRSGSTSSLSGIEGSALCGPAFPWSLASVRSEGMRSSDPRPKQRKQSSAVPYVSSDSRTRRAQIDWMFSRPRQEGRAAATLLTVALLPVRTWRSCTPIQCLPWSDSVLSAVWHLVSAAARRGGRTYIRPRAPQSATRNWPPMASGVGASTH
jgi:hypothetical protein